MNGEGNTRTTSQRVVGVGSEAGVQLWDQSGGSMAEEAFERVCGRNIPGPSANVNNTSSSKERVAQEEEKGADYRFLLILIDFDIQALLTLHRLAISDFDLHSPEASTYLGLIIARRPLSLIRSYEQACAPAAVQSQLAKVVA